MSRKRKYYNNFEDLCLRRDCLSRISDVDISGIDDFKYIIQKTANIMYDKYFITFKHIGFDLDDVSSILTLYALYYMDLYSLKNNKVIMDKYVDRFKNKNESNLPSDESIKKIERNNLINFLRQKVIRLFIICKKKNANIIGEKDKTRIFAATKDSKTSCHESIMRDSKASGYRGITIREFKEAKIKAKENKTNELKDKDGFGIIEIDSYAKGLSDKDYGLIYDKDLNDSNPEEIMIDMEDYKDMESIKNKLSTMSKKEKRSYINKFIKTNKSMDKEVVIAKSILNRIAKNKENELF